jgi:hypothetical protein
MTKPLDVVKFQHFRDIVLSVVEWLYLFGSLVLLSTVLFVCVFVDDSVSWIGLHVTSDRTLNWPLNLRFLSSSSTTLQDSFAFPNVCLILYFALPLWFQLLLACSPLVAIDAGGKLSLSARHSHKPRTWSARRLPCRQVNQHNLS